MLSRWPNGGTAPFSRLNSSLSSSWLMNRNLESLDASRNLRESSLSVAGITIW